MQKPNKLRLMRLQKKRLKIDEATMSQKDFWRSLLRGSQVEAVSDVWAAGSGGLRWSTPTFPGFCPATTPATLQENLTFRTRNKNPSNNLVAYHGRLCGLSLFLPPALRSAQPPRGAVRRHAALRLHALLRLLPGEEAVTRTHGVAATAPVPKGLRRQRS